MTTASIPDALSTPVPAISEAERRERLQRARELTADAGGDALLIAAGASLRYFAGVPWGLTERFVGMLLPVKGDKPVMICPAFELGSLRADLKIDADFLLWEEDEDPFTMVAGALRDLGAKQLLVDSMLPFQMGDRLRRAAGSVTLVDGAPAIDGCRMLKSPAELALLQRAKDMTLEVHRRVFDRLRPGVRQSEVVRFIDEQHRELGAAGSSFCIVQFGHATAYPHGLPGDRELEKDQLVLVDTGCTLDGYHSDITRTYAFGSVGDEERRIWQIERDAQQAAFEAVRPGVLCEEIDTAARKVVEKAGLGPDYTLPGVPHRTGHGIGLAIHEPAYLVRGDRTPLAPGMCFSNEPMIVVPERFGVRLEDHFHVTENGAAWFTEPQPSIDRPFG
ncbi:M24 family metallopeptidase [Pacificimonas flava]|uniref:4-hydroxyproline dipeptidase n=1 Tax=Pacificimonas flava TaxID=1234595 RepID=M2U8N4_9SPHN|nr:Xaa-Pro peptidase family protein [Pacificimonas flava]EMD84322.1 4-hydroxyproline dipeptidase [Pacificimonas flava]MBB5279803.1 Xaa-Pro dipeptidase [Pacificimonas flava]